eukprot:18691-Heterococcus_DN1.PRE.1
MIVQAIGLLDELDKEINTYAMRVREWYGWHFPEMAKILNDNMHFAKCVLRMGTRDKCKHVDFSDIIGDESIEHTLKENAEISMGTEITDMDLKSISALAEQTHATCHFVHTKLQCIVLYTKSQCTLTHIHSTQSSDASARPCVYPLHTTLHDNIQHHNTTQLQASTVQILGAEKALFRALKTKHDTPKYGLIYHASLIGQTAPKNKGKISRVLAAKTALAIRVDAMGETTDTTLGLESRAKSSKRQCSSVTALAIALASFSKRATCTTAVLQRSVCIAALVLAWPVSWGFWCCWCPRRCTLLAHTRQLGAVEARIRLLEGGARLSLSGAKTPSGVKKYDAK